MKRIFLTLVLFAAVLIGAAQIVPVQAKTFRIGFGGQTFTINMNIDSVLMDCKEPVWFNSKFGSDTLLFGDKTYMVTAALPASSDTGYVHSWGDTICGTYNFCGTSSVIERNRLFFVNGAAFAGFEPEVIYVENATNSCKIYPDKIILEGSGYIETNDVIMKTEALELINDASIILTNGISGWGEVYAFNAGAIDEWAEFIISSDGAVYLKSNSTDVVNTDTDNKLCIFDNGTGVTIRNRLGGTRIIKYIIHH